MSSKTEEFYQEQLNQVTSEFEDFVYIVSHDLKAPIRAITNLSTWIEEDLGQDIPEDVLANLKLLRDRTHRLEHMMNAILQLSRVNRYDLDIKPTDLVKTLQEVKEAHTKPHVKITLEVKLNPGLLTTYCKKFKTVVEHLVQNAICHNDKEQVEITISISKAAEGIAEITIADNGPGIPDHALDKIFKIFFTGKPKDRDYSVGVGLTLTKKIIDFIGGTITLERSQENGSKFVITWPEISQ